MIFLFFKKNNLYVNKILKKDINISNDRIITWLFSLIIFERSFTGKNPPDEMSVRAKFNESKDLIEKIFKTKKIKSVIIEYRKKILIACFNISELLNEIKLVNDFLKLSS